MALNRLLISLCELALMIVVSGVVITLIYRAFLKATPEIDFEEEIRKGNAAVGIVMATIMISVAMLLQKGLVASISTFRLTMATPEEMGIPLWGACLLILGHLVFTLALAIATISVTLRLVGWLLRRINPGIRYGKLLVSGNIAVGLLMSSIVLITTLYVGEGVSAVTKALVPQPKIGSIQIMQ
jgi:hypothetical protein